MRADPQPASPPAGRTRGAAPLKRNAPQTPADVAVAEPDERGGGDAAEQAGSGRKRQRIAKDAAAAAAAPAGLADADSAGARRRSLAPRAGTSGGSNGSSRADGSSDAENARAGGMRRVRSLPTMVGRRGVGGGSGGEGDEMLSASERRAAAQGLKEAPGPWRPARGSHEGADGGGWGGGGGIEERESNVAETLKELLFKKETGFGAHTAAAASYLRTALPIAVTTLSADQQAQEVNGTMEVDAACVGKADASLSAGQPTATIAAVAPAALLPVLPNLAGTRGMARARSLAANLHSYGRELELLQSLYNSNAASLRSLSSGAVGGAKVAEGGGLAYSFLNSECGLCNGALSQPVSLLCRHRFCWECLKEAGGSNDIHGCPLCERAALAAPAIDAAEPTEMAAPSTAASTAVVGAAAAQSATQAAASVAAAATAAAANPPSISGLIPGSVVAMSCPNGPLVTHPDSAGVGTTAANAFYRSPNWLAVIQLGEAAAALNGKGAGEGKGKGWATHPSFAVRADGMIAGLLELRPTLSQWALVEPSREDWVALQASRTLPWLMANCWSGFPIPPKRAERWICFPELPAAVTAPAHRGLRLQSALVPASVQQAAAQIAASNGPGLATWPSVAVSGGGAPRALAGVSGKRGVAHAAHTGGRKPAAGRGGGRGGGAHPPQQPVLQPVAQPFQPCTPSDQYAAASATAAAAAAAAVAKGGCGLGGWQGNAQALQMQQWQQAALASATAAAAALQRQAQQAAEGGEQQTPQHAALAAVAATGAAFPASMAAIFGAGGLAGMNAMAAAGLGPLAAHAAAAASRAGRSGMSPQQQAASGMLSLGQGRQLNPLQISQLVQLQAMQHAALAAQAYALQAAQQRAHQHHLQQQAQQTQAQHQANQQLQQQQQQQAQKQAQQVAQQALAEQQAQRQLQPPPQQQPLTPPPLTPPSTAAAALPSGSYSLAASLAEFGSLSHAFAPCGSAALSSLKGIRALPSLSVTISGLDSLATTAEAQLPSGCSSERKLGTAAPYGAGESGGASLPPPPSHSWRGTGKPNGLLTPAFYGQGAIPQQCAMPSPANGSSYLGSSLGFRPAAQSVPGTLGGPSGAGVKVFCCCLMMR